MPGVPWGDVAVPVNLMPTAVVCVPKVIHGPVLFGNGLAVTVTTPIGAVTLTLVGLATLNVTVDELFIPLLSWYVNVNCRWLA